MLNMNDLRFFIIHDFAKKNNIFSTLRKRKNAPESPLSFVIETVYEFFNISELSDRLRRTRL